MVSRLSRVLAAAADTPTAPFPGDQQEQLPPVPRRPLAKHMFTAHRIDDLQRSLSHCRERMQALRTVKPGERQYHLMHVNNHLTDAAQQAQELADNIRRNYPAEHAELQALNKTIGFARALSDDAKAATFSHLLQTVKENIGHAKRHAMAMKGAASSGKLWDFNWEHCDKHVTGAAEHAQKLADHVRDNYPAEADWLNQLETHLTAETPEASTVPKPIHPNGSGLWHHKGMMAPPYVEHVAQALMRKGHGESDAYHMAWGIIQNWAKGKASTHHGHVHADVRAAAAANAAREKELQAQAHAETAAKHAKHHVAASSAESAVELASWQATAPGARAVPTGQQLYQRPSQTVSASPPLPPAVKLPTPAELNALAASIEKAPSVPDEKLVSGAAAHARAAAAKMTSNQPVDALHCLRACQAGIISAHRSFNASQIPVANVFTASLDPQAAAAAREKMYQGLRDRENFRALASQVASHIDRIRRQHFHGLYNHLAEARFSAVELAAGNSVSSDSTMVYLAVPQDLLPQGYPQPLPGETEPLPHLTVVYCGHTTPAQFADICERVKAAAKAVPPLHGYVGGLGFFDPSESSGNMQVAYCPAHVTGIWQLRSLLKDLVPLDALPFHPHVTLAYLGPGDQPPPPVTSGTVCFSQVHARRGSEDRAFSFGVHSHLPHPHGGRRPLPRPGPML
jgi:hypothetical protein